jgi:hypothetical protein
MSLITAEEEKDLLDRWEGVVTVVVIFSRTTMSSRLLASKRYVTWLQWWIGQVE